MKKIILMIAVAQYLGCAPDHGNSQAVVSNGADKLSCQVAGRISDKSNDNSNSDPNVNSSVGIIQPLAAVAGSYNSFIVKYKSQSPTALSLAPSGQPVHEFAVKGISFQKVSLGTYSFSLTTSAEEKQKYLADLSSQQDVEYVEPDYPIFPIQETNPGDTQTAVQFSDQWSLSDVHLKEAWNVTKGSKDIVIAILDSGIDYRHQDLKNNIWVNPNEIPDNGVDDDGNGFIDDVYGWNFADNNSDPKTRTTSNHGSHVAGIIGGNRGDGQGIYGMAQNVKMMALKFIGENGSGSTSAAIRGIDYAIAKKVFAINNSWGSSGGSTALQAAIGRAEKAGILFVVAAGNGSGGHGYSIDNTGWYPASYSNPNILTVAATASNDFLTSFSNFGLHKVDVAAPGLNILSTVTNQSYQKMSGTSMAAPLVTGLAVLVKAANTSLNYQQVINIIRNTVDKLPSMSGKIASGGRVNAFSAVALASQSSGGKSPAVDTTCP